MPSFLRKVQTARWPAASNTSMCVIDKGKKEGRPAVANSNIEKHATHTNRNPNLFHTSPNFGAVVGQKRTEEKRKRRNNRHDAAMLCNFLSEINAVVWFKLNLETEFENQMIAYIWQECFKT